MRALAFVLLCSCAAKQASSLPVVTIDRSLSGAVISREGAEVIAVLRARERGRLGEYIIECEGQNGLLASEIEAQRKHAATGLWWSVNGPLVVVISAIASAALGVSGGFAIAK